MSSAVSHPRDRVFVQLAQDGASTSVVVGGDLDALAAPELDGILGGVIALDDGSVTVDLSGLDFVGAAGARSPSSAGKRSERSADQAVGFATSSTHTALPGAWSSTPQRAARASTICSPRPPAPFARPRSSVG